MGELAPDIHEQILVRLDVKTLIICKSICKSWHSLISSTRFIKTHLNYSHNNDCTNNAIGRRRIRYYYIGDKNQRFYLVGSDNGLVCISEVFKGEPVLVANPLTREVKTLKTLELPWISISSRLCWGFGYDSSTDDYKVIVGITKGLYRTIGFQILSLKSNVWIDIGEELNSKFMITTNGTLCNGRLHWAMRDRNDKRVKVLSFDLSKEEFKEIRLPDDVIYNFGHHILGVIKECLCIYDHACSPCKIWVMNNDDLKQPWKLMANDHGIENHIVHYLRQRDYLPDEISFSNVGKFPSKCVVHFSSPIYVQSLVSPHVKEDIEYHDNKC